MIDTSRYLAFAVIIAAVLYLLASKFIQSKLISDTVQLALSFILLIVIILFYRLRKNDIKNNDNGQTALYVTLMVGCALLFAANIYSIAASLF